MGIANIGIPGLILIVILALIIFGPKKLPEIGKAAGQTLQAFKSSANDLVTDEDENQEDSEKKVANESENKSNE